LLWFWSRSESVSEAGKYVIGLHWPECEGVRQSNVYAAANDKVECIVARVVHYTGRKLSTEVAVKTGVSSPKQNFGEWLNPTSAGLDYGAHVVGEEIRRGGCG